MTDSNLAMPDLGLPQGMAVKRADESPKVLRWFVYDRLTNLYVAFAVDTDDFLVPWTPPRASRWWQWFSPLGAAARNLDRRAIIQRHHEAGNPPVVDWWAVETAVRERGGDAIRELIAKRDEIPVAGDFVTRGLRDETMPSFPSAPGARREGGTPSPLRVRR